MNTSSAVMQQRHEPPDGLDDFPTPPWATRALCQRLFPVTGMTCREPAANRGHMVKPLREYFLHVDAFDIHDYGAGFPVKDYLADDDCNLVDWTISNPPFNLAEQFIVRAMRDSIYGVAMFTRVAFLESVGRYERLFKRMPPQLVLQFTERVVLHKGKLAPNGSTATAYCWLVWHMNSTQTGTQLDWIPPCRKRLEKPEDYL